MLTSTTLAEDVVLLSYIGGMIPAYRAARDNDHNILSSVLNALIWPADVGWHLAETFCQDDKG